MGKLLSFVGGIFNLKKPLPAQSEIQIGRLVKALPEFSETSFVLGCTEYETGKQCLIEFYPNGAIQLVNRSKVDLVNPTIMLTSPVGPIASIS